MGARSSGASRSPANSPQSLRFTDPAEADAQPESPPPARPGRAIRDGARGTDCGRPRLPERRGIAAPMQDSAEWQVRDGSRRAVRWAKNRCKRQPSAVLSPKPVPKVWRARLLDADCLLFRRLSALPAAAPRRVPPSQGGAPSCRATGRFPGTSTAKRREVQSS